MSRPPAGAAPAEPPRYELRVQGVLDDRWSAWFDGLRVTSDQPGQTTIAGPVADQAALHGLLAKVRDLGLELLLVRRIDPTPNPHRGSDATASHPNPPTPDPTVATASHAQAAAWPPANHADRPAHPVRTPAPLLRQAQPRRSGDQERDG